MAAPQPFYVRGPDHDHRQVEAWSTYPIQFEGQRKYAWITDMVYELRDAIDKLAVRPGEVLSGLHLATESGAIASDVQNRLFLNPGEVLPKQLTGIRFEAGVGAPPPPAVPLLRIGGHLFYYRYRRDGRWACWEPAQVLASWERIPRELPDDGTARPYWYALMRAASSGRISCPASSVAENIPLGIRLTIHGTPRGPRRASPTLTENVVDGTLAAFHASPPDVATVTAALTAKLKRPELDRELRMLLSGEAPCVLFSAAAIRVKGAFVQISPCDERCYAGEVVILPGDARGSYPEISGELFTLRRQSADGAR